MNRQKFSSIAHRDHDYCNPISTAKIEKLLDLLPLDGTFTPLPDGDYHYTLTVKDMEGHVIDSRTRMVQISTGGPQGNVPVIPVE